jgi:hypothetical protein
MMMLSMEVVLTCSLPFGIEAEAQAELLEHASAFDHDGRGQYPYSIPPGELATGKDPSQTF